MALFLLQKTPLIDVKPLQVNGQPVHAHYRNYNALLHPPLQGKSVSLILAEPVLTPATSSSPDTLAWYIDTPHEPRPLHNLSPSEAEATRQQIAHALRLVFSTASDQQNMVEHILSSPTAENIFITPSHIIICNWGLWADPQQDSSPFSTSFLGKILSSSLTPSSKAPSPPLEQAHAATSARSQETILSSPPKKASVFNSLTLISKAYILCLLALFFLAGFLIGLRLIWAQQPTQINGLSLPEARQLVQNDPAVQKKNTLLQKEVESLEEQLKHPSCNLHKDRADTGLNHLVPKQAAPLQKDGQAFGGSLPRLLTQSTVFITGIRTDNGVVSGSGFFITPDTILTNRHVIENLIPNGLLVANKAIGKLVPAQIIGVSHDSIIGHMDLAVLHVSNIPPQQPLVLTPTINPLDDVVAAGYPGMLLKTDSNFLRLLKEGDPTAIPGVILTKGQVNAIQTDSSGFEIMPHSATVSEGNSGGPLVDMCGRVVGINTFVTAEKETSTHGNYAIKTDSLIAVLQKAHIPITVKEDSCSITNTSPSTANHQPEHKPDDMPKSPSPTEQGNMSPPAPSSESSQPKGSQP